MRLALSLRAGRVRETRSEGRTHNAQAWSGYFNALHGESYSGVRNPALEILGKLILSSVWWWRFIVGTFRRPHLCFSELLRNRSACFLRVQVGAEPFLTRKN